MDPFSYVLLHCSLFWVSLWVHYHVVRVYSRASKKGQTPIRTIVSLHNYSYLLQMVVTLLQCTALTQPTTCAIAAYLNVEGHVLQMYFSNVYITQALLMMAFPSKKMALWKSWAINIPALASAVRVYNIRITADATQAVIFNVCDYSLSQEGVYISTSIWGAYGLAFLAILAVSPGARNQEALSQGETTETVRLGLFRLIFKYRILFLIATNTAKAVIDALCRPWPVTRLALVNTCLFLEFGLLNVEVLAVKTKRASSVTSLPANWSGKQNKSKLLGNNIRSFAASPDTRSMDGTGDGPSVIATGETRSMITNVETKSAVFAAERESVSFK
ncbi:hypothetical protein CcCBS67573_g04751 [Chytriomyces confervae]|uniref:Uncharacterized protein n=1 Tax=Chytriomyces confervae TaxID=246404 RepID=A0A507FCA0_9FUNG|nr:hypothetical protein HDU80_006828 [Chytriomyces hyalinus]TPX73969.1 hypothetical protein CcCBS67573_g04751 [Chytriomyces confervae]